MKSVFEFPKRNRIYLEGVLAALLIALASINVFSRLGTEKIYSWDEARHGVSACEMMESGNYLVNTYNYNSDYWNLKPVLAFYNNIIGMKLFGRTIFGFRFFSAFCYLAIAVLMYLFLRKEAGAAAALIGTATFVTLPTNWVHSFRTGDPDATYMLFCFAAFVCLWYSARKGRLLALSAFFLGLAFLVKSFHVGIHGILALIFVGLHWKRYSWRDLLLAVVSGAAPVLLWAALRFHADGMTFFRNMVLLDLLGRLESGDHSEVIKFLPWYEYFSTLNHYLLVIPVAITAGAVVAGMLLRGKKCFSSSSESLGRWALFCFLVSFSAFCLCRVKLKWYIFPSLLYFSVAFGTLFQFACRWLREEADMKRSRLLLLPPLAVIVGSIVWECVGEGKAIRNVVKLDSQEDVLTTDQGGDAYRGKVFYSVDHEGKPEYPHQKFMLVIRFLDAKIALKDVEEYRNASDDALLVCRFEETKTERLRPLAEEFASRHSLKLIRYSDGQALYQR